MYPTYNRLPAIGSHTHAAKLFSGIKPIRGRSPAIYPLGQRNKADEFSIRQTLFGDIQCLHYSVPLVTFHHDGRVILGLGEGPEKPDAPRPPHTIRRWTISDAVFVEAILRFNYVEHASTTGGRLLLKMRDGRQFIVNSVTEGMAFSISPEAKTMQPADEKAAMTLRINRAAANNVRARYGAFLRYAKGMIAVRRQTGVKSRVWSYAHNRYEDLVMQFMELAPGELAHAHAEATLAGDEARYDFIPQYRERVLLVQLANKPPISSLVSVNMEGKGMAAIHSAKPYEEWKRCMHRFLGLITPADPSHMTDADYANFAQAFNRVLLECYMNSMFTGAPTPDHAPRIPVADIHEKLNELLFKYFSEEVFEWAQVNGTTPSRKYEGWLTCAHGRWGVRA